MATPPSVVLVVLDTVRRDRVSAYGYEHDTTPAFDEFASRATLFEDPVSQAAWSVPAHASLLTGLYPTAHGATTIRPVLRARRPLPAQLQAAGYEAYAVSPNEYIRPITGFGRGFDEFWTGSPLAGLESAASAVSPTLNRFTSNPHIRRPLERGFNWARRLGNETGTVSPAEYGVRERVEQILAHASDPFFLFVNLPHAHLPRSPEPGYRATFVDDDRPTESVVANERAHVFGEHRMGPEAMQAMSQLYDADLRTVDDRLRDVLAMLSCSGALDDALVILVADHGEHLGEFDLVGHQHSVFEPVVSVPLAIQFPDGGPATVDEQVETRRVYHTILDVAGVSDFPALSLASGEGDAVTRGSFHSPMLDIPALLRDGTVAYDRALLGEALSFERADGRKTVSFGDDCWEFSLPESETDW